MPTAAKTLFRSRRFYATIAGIVTVILHEMFGITEEQSGWIAALLASWIVGDALRKT